MWALPRPVLSAREVFLRCCSRMENSVDKERFELVADQVAAEAVCYERAACHNQLHTIPMHETVGGLITAAEMANHYAGRMARARSPGRMVYDQLMAAAPHGRCPFCGQRIVAQLDHYLPKSAYPVFAVTPANLVPSCADCNKAKGERRPVAPSESFLHPYFDRIEGSRWLYADVQETAPPSVQFFVSAPTGWDGVTVARVERQFQVLGLASLYSSLAADELVNLRHQLVMLHVYGGVDAVRKQLEDRAASCFTARPNSWQTATYEALRSSSWYCREGFAYA